MSSPSADFAKVLSQCKDELSILGTNPKKLHETDIGSLIHKFMVDNKSMTTDGLYLLIKPILSSLASQAKDINDKGNFFSFKGSNSLLTATCVDITSSGTPATPSPAKSTATPAQSPVTPSQFVAPAFVKPVINKLVTNQFDFDAIAEYAETVFEATCYVGFSVDDVRASVESMLLSDLCALLSAYSNIGNNMSKLNSTRLKDKNVSTQVYRTAAGAKISAKKREGFITLSNLATSFLPLYFSIRSQLKDKLQNQFPETMLPPLYQDPVMGPLAVIHGFESQFRNYQKAFFKVLPRAKEFKASSNDWLRLSCVGYNQDKDLNPHSDVNSSIQDSLRVIQSFRDGTLISKPVVPVKLTTSLTDEEIDRELKAATKK